MKANRINKGNFSGYTKFAVAAALVMPLALLNGCSAVPDWANPVEWYKGAAELVSGSEKNKQKSKVEQLNSGEGSVKYKKFPSLSSVPKQPQSSTMKERKRVSDALLADRQNARYSQKRLLRQVPPKRLSTSELEDRVQRSLSRAKSKPGLAKRKHRSGVISKSGPSETVSNLNTSKTFYSGSKGKAHSVKLNSDAKPLIKQPNPRVSSRARVGNPIFGAPPSDIAIAKSAKVVSEMENSLSAPPAVPGTQSPGSVYTAKRGATIRFASGSSVLTKEARSVLRKIAEVYRQRGGALRIDGHASSRTRDMTMVKHHMVNFKISLKRANAVARELIRQGVSSESLFVSAISDSKPIYLEIMPAGDAGNQRVEIYFVN